MALILRLGFYNAYATFFFQSAPFFVSLFTFVAYTLSGNDLTPTTVCAVAWVLTF